MEVTKEDVIELIELRKENTFLDHLWNVLSRDSRPKGEITRDNIKVWQQSVWNATFYPIFIFEFNTNNQLINITDELNPIGKMLIGLFFIGTTFLILTNLSTDIVKNWLPILIVSSFLLILSIVCLKLYLFEKNNQLKEIYVLLDIEIEKEKPEREWSLENMLIRLFTYPFCMFLIYINLFLLIPKGEFTLALSSFGFVSFYLVTDLKMIFRNRTTGKNT